MGYETKPREERHFKEIYPDLDECKALPVFIINNKKDTIEEYEEKIKLNQPIVGPLNSVRFVKLPESREENVSFDRKLIDYGFEDPVGRNKRTLSHYHRPYQSENNESITDVVDKKRRLVEYDMDEQDFMYLNHLNDQLVSIKLHPAYFEILITILENEWSKIELEMNANEEESLITAGVDYQGIINDEEYGNDDGIVGGLPDDQKCAVCNDSDCDNSNAIVFCDGCNIAVHQECYGVAFIPEGQWLCRKCMINKHKQFDCTFCPSKTGAFKQLDNSLWSHLVCGLWINELYFANPIYMEPIEGIDLIPKSRWRLNCYICKLKVGACIQCVNKNCFSAYHVTCAKRAKLCMQMTKGVQGGVHNKLTLKSYCDKHTPNNYYLNQKQIIEGINKTRKYYRDLKLINIKNDQLNRTKKLNNKLNIFKWKTDLNTPIAPKLFSDLLLNKLVSFKLDETIEKRSQLRGLGNKLTLTKEDYYQQLEKLSNDICKYWCLKREQKNGASLIRKNNNLIDNIVYGGNELVDEKLKFSEILKNDLVKLINISEMNFQRQLLMKEKLQNDLGLIDFETFPLKKFIDHILNNIILIDNKKLLRHMRTFNLQDIINKNKEFKYDSLRELVEDIEKLDSNIQSNALKKTSKKILEYMKNFKNRKFQVSHLNGDHMDESELSELENLDKVQEVKLSKFLHNK
ncbi:nuA3 HAT complex component Nto1p [[Candida] jaroonii]|uniref:NuA3 HAT complex component Nto1p n=1 Tax=[Candida] jaroonii TaxID=467808 RepID=A0ACA9YAM6_9ASCO|nr:nuA3 HAT complex component Nto1p [[Candida] jaroonii]